MANIALKRPSGGQLILAPEDGASTDTVTIPSSGVMAADVATGKILQVVQQVKTDSTIVGSIGVGWTDVSNNSATITPSSTTSKILVTVMVNGSASVDGLLRLVRNSTAIGTRGVGNPSGTAFIGMRGNSYEGFSTTMVYLDSPASTATQTYKWQIAGSGGTTFYINRTPVSDTADETTICTITLMEVAA